MTEKDFSLVRRLTDFLKRYKYKDYEVFNSEGDEILVHIYNVDGDPEVWVGLDDYEVVFDEDNTYVDLTLEELLEKLYERGKHYNYGVYAGYHSKKRFEYVSGKTRCPSRSCFDGFLNYMDKNEYL